MAAISLTFNHSAEIFILIDLAPVDAHAQALFEDEVKPDARAAAIALHERMCHIHLDIFGNNLVEGILGHLFDCLQVQWQILCKTE